MCSECLWIHLYSPQYNIILKWRQFKKKKRYTRHSVWKKMQKISATATCCLKIYSRKQSCPRKMSDCKLLINQSKHYTPTWLKQNEVYAWKTLMSVYKPLMSTEAVLKTLMHFSGCFYFLKLTFLQLETVKSILAT